MHPILFEIPIPGFLQGFFGSTFTIYSYGFMIVLGAISGISYVAYQTKKKFDLPFERVNTLFLLLLAAAYIGGKAFLFFEKPAHYLDNFSALLSGRGFVFYGSLLFTIPTMLWYFKKNKLPAQKMLDIMAITTCIVHIFGRMGCFLAGCCHGVEWHGPLAVTFTDPVCMAKPLGTPLHPTQLYSVTLILTILVVLLIIKKYQKFEGQLFLSYILLYAIGRSIIEIFRGDISRGFVIDGILSHSQFISLVMLLVGGYFYYKLYNKNSRLENK